MRKLLISSALASLLALTVLPAADIQKANNTNNLSVTTSWVGGTVPGAGDVAVYDSTLTTTGTASQIGGNVSFLGIKMLNPSGTLYAINNSASSTLTIGASGIDMSAATANLSIGALLNMSADQTWTVAAGRTLTVSSTNFGTNTLTLAGGGTFVIGNNQSLGAGTVVMNNGITLTTVGGTSSRTLGNAVTLNGDITIASSSTGGGTFLFNGGMDIGSGSKTISVVNPNGAFNNPSLSFGGGGSAAGKQVIGSGTLVFANANAATSPVVGIRLGVSGTDYAVFHTGGVVVGTGVSLYFNTSNVFSTDTDLTVQSGGVLNLSNNGGSAVTQTVRSLMGSGTVTSQRTAAALSSLIIDSGTSTMTANFAGNIITGTAGASIALTKLGSSTQILSGSNNYIGQTLVSAGTLLVSGTHTDSSAVTNNGYGALASGHFQAASGATFGGSGYIAGVNSQNNSNMVLIQNGGALNPGTNGIGTLTLDGINITGATASRVLNMASGAVFNIELAGNGGTPDRVDFWNYVSGDLLLNSNAINLSLSGSVAAGTYTVSLFRFFSDSGITGVNSGLLSGLTIGTVGAGISGTPTLNFNSGGNTIDLTYTVIPEPSAVLLCGVGLAMVLWRRRSA